MKKTERNHPVGLQITAGMGSAEDYGRFCDAGANEVFTGYAPEEWQRQYGMAMPINRRESRSVNVQLGGRNDLEILRNEMDRRGTPVTLAFNSPFYAAEQIQPLVEIMNTCAENGFDRMIIADPALLYAMEKNGLTKRCSVQISGEMGTMNRETARLCREMGAKRVIFHRKTPITDMEAIIRAVPGMEYEAFALNENCHFHGAFCHTLHCDELPHMCRVPCRPVTDGTVGWHDAAENTAPLSREAREAEEDDLPIPGATGCGLCALWRLRHAGVTHLKLVGRGNWPEATERDIMVLRQAARIAEQTEEEAAYITWMKREIFPDGCSGRCYYG